MNKKIQLFGSSSVSADFKLEDGGGGNELEWEFNCDGVKAE